MTQPLGEAYVEIIASVENFEKDLARQLKRIAKKQGQSFGESLAKNTLTGFRNQLRADEKRFEAAGRLLGTAVRRGFDGATVGDRMGQDLIRGIKGRLSRANLGVGGGAVVSTKTAEVIREGLATAAEQAENDFLNDIRRRRLLLEIKTEVDQDKLSDSVREGLATAVEEGENGFLNDLRRKRLLLEIKADVDQAKFAKEQARIRAALQAQLDRDRGRVQSSVRFEERIRGEKVTNRDLFGESLGPARALARGFDLLVGGLPATLSKISSLVSGAFSGVGQVAGKTAGFLSALSSRIALAAGQVTRLSALLGGAAKALGIAGVAASALAGVFGVVARGLAVVTKAFTFFGKTILSLRLVSQLGGVVQGIRVASGSLLGFAPILTTVGGALLLFGGESEALAAAMKPLGDAFSRVRDGAQGLFATLLKSPVKQLAGEVPALQEGLNAFAVSLADSFGSLSQAVVDTDFAARFGAALANIGAAISTFAATGLQPLLDLFARINEQVSARLPDLALRLGEFFDRLNEKFATTDFGLVFERGVQAVVDFLGAVVNLGRALSALADAIFVDVRDDDRTFFATVREGLADLTEFLRRPETVEGLQNFFSNVKALAELINTVILTSFRAFGAVIRGFLGELTGAGVGKVSNFREEVRLIGERIKEATPRILEIAEAFGKFLADLIQVIQQLTSLAAFAARTYTFVLNVTGLGLLDDALGKIRQLAGFVFDTPSADSNPLGQTSSVSAADVRRAQQADQLAQDILSTQRALAAIGKTSQSTDEFDRGAGRQQVERLRLEQKLVELRRKQSQLRGPRSGSIFGRNAAAAAANAASDAAAATRNAADLQGLLEDVLDGLTRALRRGGAEVSEEITKLQRTIRDGLEGTLQEGLTGQANRFLESQRKGLVAAANQYQIVSDNIEKTRERLKELREEADSFRSSVIEALRSTSSIDAFLSNRQSGSATSFQGFLNKQVAKLQKFQTALATLLQRGLDPALVRELAAGGLDNQRFATNLAKATGPQIAQINALQKQINALQGGIADTTTATFQAGIDRVSAQLATQIALQQKLDLQLTLLANRIVSGLGSILGAKNLPRFAKGGFTKGPSLAGEAGPELVLPLDDRRRSMDLLRQAGMSVTTNSNNRTIAPVFNVTQAPGQDPRALAAELDARLAGLVR